MDISVYHHVSLDAQTIQALHNLGSSEVTSRLKKIEEILIKMNENEQLLDEKLVTLQTSLDASQERALTAINAQNEAIAVVNAQNVTLTELVKSLRDNAPDLTDEIASVEAAIKDSDAFLANNPPVDASPPENAPTTSGNF